RPAGSAPGLGGPGGRSSPLSGARGRRSLRTTLRFPQRHTQRTKPGALFRLQDPGEGGSAGSGAAAGGTEASSSPSSSSSASSSGPDAVADGTAGNSVRNSAS